VILSVIVTRSDAEAMRRGADSEHKAVSTDPANYNPSFAGSASIAWMYRG
jgi:hypothetical protein